MAGTFRVSRGADGRYEVTAGAAWRGRRVPIRAGRGMPEAVGEHTERALNRLDQVTLDRESFATIEAVIDRCMRETGHAPVSSQT